MESNISHNKNYDSKNLMHTFRLLDMAYEILDQGEIIVERPNREELLSIRSGEYQYDELIEMANQKMEEVKIAYEKSNLPDIPDSEAISDLLVDIRTELYDL